MKTRGCEAGLWAAVAGGALSMLLAGCGEAPGADGAEEVDVRTAAVTVSPAAFTGTAAIQYGTMWTWPNNGAALVQLISGSNTACFINAMWGSFQSAGDRLDVFKSGNTWFIGGAHGSGTPSGDAYCMSGVTVSSEFSWSGGGPVSLGSATNQTCYLNRVQGNFANSDAAIRLQIVNNEWQLSGTSGLSAAARCVNRPPMPESSINSVTSPGANLQGAAPLQLAVNTSTTGEYFCALTSVRGHFRNNGWVGTLVQESSDGSPPPRWTWRMASAGHGGGSQIFDLFKPLRATGRCVN